MIHRYFFSRVTLLVSNWSLTTIILINKFWQTSNTQSKFNFLWDGNMSFFSRRLDNATCIDFYGSLTKKIRTEHIVITSRELFFLSCVSLNLNLSVVWYFFFLASDLPRNTANWWGKESSENKGVLWESISKGGCIVHWTKVRRVIQRGVQRDAWRTTVFEPHRFLSGLSVLLTFFISFILK